MLVYVDTNVYLDFLLKRSGPEPFHKYAKWLFDLAKACKFYVLLSDHAEREVLSYLDQDSWQQFLDSLGEKIRRVVVEEEDLREAKALGAHNLSDAIHAVLAAKYGATYLFTRNLSDFAWFVPYLSSFGVKVKHPRAVYSVL